MDKIEMTLRGLATGAPALLAGLVLVVLGVACSYALGVRDRLLAVALAAPLTVGVLLATAQVMAWLRLGSDMVAVPVVGLAACVAAGLIRRHLTGRRPQRVPDDDALPSGRLGLLGGALGALLGLAVWLPGIGDPQLPPQGNDDIWHGYLTARLLSMPGISATDVAPVLADSADPHVFYPYGSHVLAAFVATWAPVGIPTAMNAVWVVAIGVLFPFGVAALLRAMLPDRPRAAFLGGLIASTFTAFPYLINGLAPYALALAMTPALLAAVAQRARGNARVPVLAIALPALAVFTSHPAGFVVAVVAATLMVLELVVVRRVPVALVVRRLGPPAVGALAMALPWLLAVSDDVGHAPLAAPLGTGFGDRLMMAATLETPWTPGQPVLAGLVLFGIVAVVRTRGAGSFLVVTSGLLVGVLLVAWSGTETLLFLTEPWYGEWHRITAAMAMMLIPVAALGADLLCDVLSRAVTRSTGVWARRGVVAAAGVVLGAVSLVSLQYVLRAQSIITTAWAAPGLVTSGDLRLFRILDREVSPGATVLGDWADGSTWMMAVAGVQPVLPYAYSAGSIPDIVALAGSIDGTPALCRVLDRRHVSHVLVKTRIGPQATPSFAGAIADSPRLFVPVYRGRTGSIYQVDHARLRECAAG